MKTKKGLLVGLFVIHAAFIFFCNVSALSTFDEYRKDLPPKAMKIIHASKSIVNKMPPFYKHYFDVYRSYTGITGYVFFSPDPPDSYRIYFTYNLDHEDFIEEMPMQTFEGDLRKLCGNGYIQDIDNKDYQDLIARSIAARFYELHPRVSSLTMTAAYYSLPSTTDYVKGIKPVFSRHLTYQFQKN